MSLCGFGLESGVGLVWVSVWVRLGYKFVWVWVRVWVGVGSGMGLVRVSVWVGLGYEFRFRFCVGLGFDWGLNLNRVWILEFLLDRWEVATYIRNNEAA